MPDCDVLTLIPESDNEKRFFGKKKEAVAAFATTASLTCYC
jgi:hypothetical protein